MFVVQVFKQFLESSTGSKVEMGGKKHRKSTGATNRTLSRQRKV